MIEPGEKLNDIAPARPAGSPEAGSLPSVAAGLTPQQVLVVAGAVAVLDSGMDPNGLADANILIFEPDISQASRLLQAAPQLESHLLRDEQELAEALGARLVYGSVTQAGLYKAEPDASARPQVAAAAKKLISQTMARARSDQATRMVCSQTWHDHLADNIKRILQVPDVTQCQGALAGLPALVVGAGPSLDASLEQLPKVGRNALILAAASALNPLFTVGVSPQMAVSMEAKDESRQFQGIIPGQTMMLAASSGHPRHFSRWSGMAGMFHLLPWLPAITGRGHVLPTGGHSTSAAFSLAILWGCNPIILVGQDLAYTDGRIHASGRPGGEDEPLPQMMQVEGIDGHSVSSSDTMLSYQLWYREACAFLKRKHPHIRVINATASGARLHGMEHMSLSKALDLLPVGDEDLGLVAKALVRLPRPQRNQLAPALSRERGQVQQIVKILDQKGLSAAKLAAQPGSAAGCTMAEISDGVSMNAARVSLKQMDRLLLTMWEGLYD